MRDKKVWTFRVQFMGYTRTFYWKREENWNAVTQTILSGSSPTSLSAENPGILPNGRLNRKVQRHVDARENTERERKIAEGGKKVKEEIGFEEEERARNDWYLKNRLVTTERSRRRASNSTLSFLPARARGVYAHTRKSVTKICIR